GGRREAAGEQQDFAVVPRLGRVLQVGAQPAEGVGPGGGPFPEPRRGQRQPHRFGRPRRGPGAVGEFRQAEDQERLDVFRRRLLAREQGGEQFEALGRRLRVVGEQVKRGLRQVGVGFAAGERFEQGQSGGGVRRRLAERRL